MVRFRRIRGWARVKSRLPGMLAAFLFVAFSLWFGGFLLWVNNLPLNPDRGAVDSQGIVVLTGGAHRIDLAVSLLGEGKGQRLLISGVNQQIEDETLRRVIGISEELFECCIDLGRVAQNTQENAIEAAAWARRNGYTSLRIVTDHTHMPRSLLEFHRAMPETALAAHPVSPTTVKGVQRPGPVALAMEYTKYWIALIRYRLSPPPPITAEPDLSEIK